VPIVAIIFGTTQPERSQGAREAGLILYPTKTKIVDTETDIFEFLGYKFKKRMKFSSNKSIKKFRDNIRKHTKRCNAHSLETIFNRTKPIQRGWFEYFKYAYKYSFSEQDGWIRRRLRSILRKHEKHR
jgi:RNA-directed DNA polymerase